MRDFDNAFLDLIEHPVFMLTPDPDGRPVYAAFNANGRTKLKKEEADILGLTAAELYPGRLGVVAYEHHCEALRTGQAREYEILLPILGRPMLVHTCLRPVLDASGRVVQIIGTSEDISNDLFFWELQTQIDTLNHEKEDFINISATDFHMPMQQLKQISELLRQGFKDLGDGKLELIGVLEELCEDSTQILGKILNHANARRRRGQAIEFDFSELVRQVAGLLDPTGDKEIECHPTTIRADLMATHVALRHLVEYAIRQASKTSDAALRLNFTAEPADAGGFKVSVQDNGNGFDGAAIAFFRGETHQKEEDRALRAIERLVKARGGVLAVQADDAGTQLSFTLPGAIVDGQSGLAA